MKGEISVPKKYKPGKTEIRFAVNKWGAETRLYYKSRQVLSIEYVSSARPLARSLRL
jgi:hypothetical protein